MGSGGKAMGLLAAVWTSGCAVDGDASGTDPVLGDCPVMLACAAEASSETYDDLADAYGAGGTCWTRVGADPEGCRTACAGLVRPLGHQTTPSCPGSWVPEGTWTVTAEVTATDCPGEEVGDTAAFTLTVAPGASPPTFDLTVRSDEPISLPLVLTCDVDWHRRCAGEDTSDGGFGELTYVLEEDADGVVTYTTVFTRPNGTCTSTSVGVVPTP